MNLRQNDDGTWTQAEPIGWQEEHGLVARALYAILGVSHCGKSGQRAWAKRS